MTDDWSSIRVSQRNLDVQWSIYLEFIHWKIVSIEEE